MSTPWRCRTEDSVRRHLASDPHRAVDADVSVDIWHLLDVHIDFAGNINRGIAAATVLRVDKCSAIPSEVVPVRVFSLQSQVLGNVFVFFNLIREDLRAFEPGVAGSVLVNGNRSKTDSDRQRCCGLQIAFPVLHSIESSECTLRETGAVHIPQSGESSRLKIP